MKFFQTDQTSQNKFVLNQKADQDFLQYVTQDEVIREIASPGKVNYKKLIELIPSVPVSNYAFLNYGNLKFENKTNSLGLYKPSFSNGSAYGDLDNDGDQDVVCCSLISRPLEGVSTNDLDAIIWLEQTSEGEFIPHSLEKGNCNHSTVVVADFDEDGDLDIATAQFEDAAIYPRSDVSIWWNNSIIPQ